MLNTRLTPQAARTYGCRVDSLTLSVEQKTLAEERVRAAGLEGMVRIHLMDYRDIPSDFEHAFDAFISIEMLEHVGSHVSLSLQLHGSGSPDHVLIALQEVLQTCRLRSQADQRNRSGQCFDVPRMPL